MESGVNIYLASSSISLTADPSRVLSLLSSKQECRHNSGLLWIDCFGHITNRIYFGNLIKITFMSFFKVDPQRACTVLVQLKDLDLFTQPAFTRLYAIVPPSLIKISQGCTSRWYCLQIFSEIKKIIFQHWSLEIISMCWHRSSFYAYLPRWDKFFIKLSLRPLLTVIFVTNSHL